MKANQTQRKRESDTCLFPDVLDRQLFRRHLVFFLQALSNRPENWCTCWFEFIASPNTSQNCAVTRTHACARAHRLSLTRTHTRVHTHTHTHLVVVLGELEHLLDDALVGFAVRPVVFQREAVDPALLVQIQQHLRKSWFHVTGSECGNQLCLFAIPDWISQITLRQTSHAHFSHTHAQNCAYASVCKIMV